MLVSIQVGKFSFPNLNVDWGADPVYECFRFLSLVHRRCIHFQFNHLNLETKLSREIKQTQVRYPIFLANIVFMISEHQL